jgi:hypothetical protein
MWVKRWCEALVGTGFGVDVGEGRVMGKPKAILWINSPSAKRQSLVVEGWLFLISDHASKAAVLAAGGWAVKSAHGW